MLIGCGYSCSGLRKRIWVSPSLSVKWMASSGTSPDRMGRNLSQGHNDSAKSEPSMGSLRNCQSECHSAQLMDGHKHRVSPRRSGTGVKTREHTSYVFSSLQRSGMSPRLCCCWRVFWQSAFGDELLSKLLEVCNAECKCAVPKLSHYDVVRRKDHVNGCDGCACTEEGTRQFIGAW